jgi:hypothetical protein
MKSKAATASKVCSPPVLTESTLSTPEIGIQQRDLPRSSSIRSVLLLERGRSRTKRQVMRETLRRHQIVDLVFRMWALRGDQIKAVLYTKGGDSRCQRDLTLLVRNGWLDRLPRLSVNEPAVYLLTRRSAVGNRLMKERYGEVPFHRQMFRLGSLEHLLGVNDVRVRVERACRDLGWTLKVWQQPEELAPLMASSVRLVPDAYFQIQREVDGQPKTSGFFLELQRAIKSSRVLESKLRRYTELYHSGRYQELFGTRALRILVVFTSELGRPGYRRVESALQLAEQLGITLARFASLDGLRQGEPQALLLRPVWWQPSQPEAVPLFQPLTDQVT